MLLGRALNQLIRMTDIVTISLLVYRNRPSMAAIILTLIANTLKILVEPRGYKGVSQVDILNKIVQITLHIGVGSRN
ncbi:hypothetical protein D3C85_930530 [compost metagenome]